MKDWKTKLFGSAKAYNRFIRDIKSNEVEEFPSLSFIDDIETITLSNISEMITDIEADTGLHAETDLYKCDECDRLHMILLVDFPDDEGGHAGNTLRLKQ